MARYDIHPVSTNTGFLLNIQSDLLEDLTTRVVVPLMPETKAPKAAERLNPIFEIDGKRYVLVTQFLSSVSISMLATSVDNIAQHHDEIVAAIDMLTQGF